MAGGLFRALALWGVLFGVVTDSGPNLEAVTSLRGLYGEGY